MADPTRLVTPLLRYFLSGTKSDKTIATKSTLYTIYMYVQYSIRFNPRSRNIDYVRHREPFHTRHILSKMVLEVKYTQIRIVITHQTDDDVDGRYPRYICRCRMMYRICVCSQNPSQETHAEAFSSPGRSSVEIHRFCLLRQLA